MTEAGINPMHSGDRCPPPTRPLPRARWERVLIWVVLPPLATVLLAGLGAVLGSVLGRAQGTAEGEGFIGFLLGLQIGTVLGLLAGVLLAWRLTRRPPAPASSPQGSR